jgi:hypothetical protein
MNRNELQSMFRAKFSEESYHSLIKSLFPSGDFFTVIPDESKDLSAGKVEFAKRVLQLGNCKLSDDSNIRFYQIELKEGKEVARNRVGLRNLLVSRLTPGVTDGIFASYYNPSSKDWRISFLSKSLTWDNESKQVKSETNPRRYTFVVGETETVTTAVERFERLFKHAGEIKLEHILEAFSVEKISDEFFTTYRHQFELFTDYITGSTQFSWFKNKAKEQTAEKIDEQAKILARNFVKKLLGRIVFLYFLQKKGWLGVPKDGAWGDGPRDFVGKLFEDFQPRSEFYNECLVPLFFHTLNRKRTNDIFSITKTRIPYLNGGLFERDHNEPESFKFKVSLFEDLFSFFNNYNFTIDENSPEDQDIGIDPEMLGRIFENLLEENIRGERGTFYTPKDVVHYMCKESLRCYIRSKLEGKATENELKTIDCFVYQTGEIKQETLAKHAQAIDSALSQVKICDPAIGSGAFPMGMVYEILRIKKELFGYISARKSFNYGKEKLNIIKHSIYGVDIDQGAIDIARLRFWLSLIVDEEEPRPLPNLDYKLMQGDSLREWYDNIRLDKLVHDENQPTFLEEPVLDFGDEFGDPQKKLKLTLDQKLELKKLVNTFFEVEDQSEKQKLRKQIDNIVDKHLKANVEYEKSICRQKIENGHRLTAKELEKEKKRLKEIEEKERQLLKLETAVEKPFFLWNLFFGDVLVDNKGFDIVIGNPPYGVKVDEDVTGYYELGSKDSYGAFMSLGLRKLLKIGGTLCLIVSDTWLTIKSHFPLRKQALEWQLKKVIRLHQDCFDATVNSCIILIHKDLLENNHNNEIFAFDLTGLSTRTNTNELNNILYNVETASQNYSGIKYGAYCYKQEEIFADDLFPVFVGSLYIFKLNAFKNHKNSIEFKRLGDEYTKNQGKKIWVKEGLYPIISGIKTGNNMKYLGIINNIGHKTLPSIDKNLVMSKKEIDKMTEDEKLDGLPNEVSKYYIPFEMGMPSNTQDGILPCYYQPQTTVFINWSKIAVKSMKNEPHSDLANSEFRFLNSYDNHISFSFTGQYAPTFRLANSPVFLNAASRIIINNSHDSLFCLAILNSKLMRYIFKTIINHTVNFEVDDVKRAIVPTNVNREELIFLVKSIIDKQKQNLKYNYLSNEQKEIDRIVYNLYGLNEEDINEVETWFARRYPKLAKYADIKHPKSKAQKDSSSKAEYYKSLIASGESRTVEFKQTLRYDIREKKINKDVEWASLKNIAAFLNSEGGTLLIGVRDEDGSITGMTADFNTFSESNKQDAFLKHFDNLIANVFGNSAHRLLKIEFVEIDGKTICAVNVRERAAQPVFVVNKQKNNAEEFYIRRFASTVSLTMRETAFYINEHWKELKVEEETDCEYGKELETV